MREDEVEVPPARRIVEKHKIVGLKFLERHLFRVGKRMLGRQGRVKGSAVERLADDPGHEISVVDEGEFAASLEKSAMNLGRRPFDQVEFDRGMKRPERCEQAWKHRRRGGSETAEHEAPLKLAAISSRVVADLIRASEELARLGKKPAPRLGGRESQ